MACVGDCQDARALEDVLRTLRSLLEAGSMSRMPLLACLGRLGGPQLFLSLVSAPLPPTKAAGAGRCTA